MKISSLAALLIALSVLTMLGCANTKTVRPAHNYTEQELMEIFGNKPAENNQETADN